MDENNSPDNVIRNIKGICGCIPGSILKDIGTGILC